MSDEISITIEDQNKDISSNRNKKKIVLFILCVIFLIIFGYIYLNFIYSSNITKTPSTPPPPTTPINTTTPTPTNTATPRPTNIIGTVTPRQTNTIINFCGMSRVVALTFDDGPDEERTPLILQELLELGIKATFFISPASRNRTPSPRQCEILGNIINQGHEIQSHTYHHHNINNLTNIELNQEILALEEWVNECLHGIIKMNQFRPPFGSLRSNNVQTINNNGYSISTWNIDTKDYLEDGIPSIINNITSQYNDGHSSIVLMHDHVYIPGTLSHIVNFFKRYNVETYITMNECLNNCLSTSCYDTNGYRLF